MRRALALLIAAGLIVLAAGLWITRPRSVAADFLAGIEPDAANGALVFAAMGCASCHKDPESPVEGELPGGHRFETAFGTFIAPNISMHETAGIGGWSDAEIASAVLHGTSPEGQHYYPAFPYASYAQAAPQDIADLIAHLRTLPAVDTPSLPHEVGFPFNIRASLGGWKLLFAGSGWVIDGDLTEEEARGRYLVEALGHCGECHTPRNALGGLDRALWMQGAENPSGDGRIPGIAGDQTGWSDGELVNFLRSGFTPDFDTAGGSMGDVVDNLALLPESDLEAIVAYLRRVPGP